MKKMNQNKNYYLKSIVGAFVSTALAIFASCEKNEDTFPEQVIAENAITGDYIKLNTTIVNSEDGIPQGFGTLKAFIGDELKLSDDSSYKGLTGKGRWIMEGNKLFLYPVDGLPMDFEVEKIDDQTIWLLQKYASYGDYADGIIAYTFIKKGIDIDLGQDLLSSIEM